MPFAWSQAALDELHRLYVREKRSATETAQALGGGVTRNAVLGKVQRLGWIRGGRRGAGRPVAAARAQAEAMRPRPRLRVPFARLLPLPKLRETPVAAPKLWTERAFGECAFPVGEPLEPGQQYACCAPVAGRGPYCPVHRDLMSQSGTALTEEDRRAILEIARRAA
jgi:GcrA cell cycle regulator